jgi:hypothetical protein
MATETVRGSQRPDCAADPEAICEAVGRPTMRFVPVKTAEQQATALPHSTLVVGLETCATAHYWARELGAPKIKQIAKLTAAAQLKAALIAPKDLASFGKGVAQAISRRHRHRADARADGAAGGRAADTRKVIKHSELDPAWDAFRKEIERLDAEYS